MEFRTLKTFQVAANFLNFTKTGEYLNFTQPTVTAQIQSLEQELKQSLFFRVGKKTYLTPAGKILKEYSDQVFSLLEEAETAISRLSNPFGTITIAASEIYCTVFLAPIISECLQLLPDVHLKLVSCHSNDVIKGIESNQYDIGIISGEIDKKGIFNVVLDEEELVLVVSKKLYDSFTVEQLFAELPLIKYRVDGNYDIMMKKFIDENKLPLNRVVEFGSEEAIKRMVINQSGIALLSSNFVKKEIAAGELMPVSLPEKVKVKTSLIVLEQLMESSSIESFCGIVQAKWDRCDLIV